MDAAVNHHDGYDAAMIHRVCLYPCAGCGAAAVDTYNDAWDKLVRINLTAPHFL